MSQVKPIWIFLKRKTVSGSGISWAICKSAPRTRQITMPAPHSSVFYRLDALPAAQPTVSKHWRHILLIIPCKVVFPCELSGSPPPPASEENLWMQWHPPDAIAACVVQSTMSNHWLEHKTLTLPVAWPHLFFILNMIPAERCYSLYTSFPTYAQRVT